MGRILVVSLFTSIFWQESVRLLCYILLHRAQRGLAMLAADVSVSGIKFIYLSRHILAIVCGLGMGVMASLFLLLNVFANYAEDGILRLPESYTSNASLILSSDAYLPISYSLNCNFLIILNISWTLILWDGLHELCFRSSKPWLSVIVVIVSHFLSTSIVVYLENSYILAIAAQLLLICADIAYFMTRIQKIPPFLRTRN